MVISSTMGTHLFAEEKQSGREMSPNAQVTFGGYNPLKLHDGTVKLLIANNLMSGEETKGESEKTSGVYVTGVNTLQAFEKLSNILIKNKVITKIDVEFISEKAKQSGGVKIGGYNVIVLYAGLLNQLVVDGKVEQTKAQAVLDSAKK